MRARRVIILALALQALASVAAAQEAPTCSLPSQATVAPGLRDGFAAAAVKSGVCPAFTAGAVQSADLCSCIEALHRAVNSETLSGDAAVQARNALASAGLMGISQNAPRPASMDWQDILASAGRIAGGLALFTLAAAVLVFFAAHARPLSTARDDATELAPAPPEPSVLVTPPPRGDPSPAPPEPIILVTPFYKPVLPAADQEETTGPQPLRPSEAAASIRELPTPSNADQIIEPASKVSDAAQFAANANVPDIAAEPPPSERPAKRTQPMAAPSDGLDSFYNRVVSLAAAYRIDQDMIAPVLELAFRFPGAPAAERANIGATIWSALGQLVSERSGADMIEPADAADLWQAVAEEMSGLVVWMAKTATQPCKTRDGTPVGRGAPILRTLAPGLVMSGSDVPAIVALA